MVDNKSKAKAKNMAEFPTMVYKSPGKHNAGHGKTFDYKGIDNQEQLDNALKIGWCLTKKDAIYGKKTEEVKKAEKKAAEEELREQLEAEASKRGLVKGVDYDGRTSTDKLQQLLYGNE